MDCVITSPPYWQLRDYGYPDQWGLEKTFEEYLENLWKLMDEIKRILKDTGTVWINLGDTYARGTRNKSGTDHTKSNAKECHIEPLTKPNYKNLDKCLLLIPHRFAIGCVDRGWILRNEIIWHKPNCMPSGATDRFTVDFEKIFFFVKNKKYWFEQQFEPLSSTTVERLKRDWKCSPNSKIASGTIGGMTDKGFNKAIIKMRERGKRNKRAVWKIPTRPSHEAHFAPFPEGLVEPMIKAGCPERGIVLDPFCGTATTGIKALQLNRKFIGIDASEEYSKIALRRLNEQSEQLDLFDQFQK